VSWLLDTNILAELRKGERGDPGVRAWYSASAAQDLYTSVLVLGEIRRGVEGLRRRDVPAALAIEQWLARVVDGFAERVLPVDGEVADLWGRLNVPNPIPAIDGLLAATALRHDLVLVTRNVRDVAPTGVRVLDPTRLGGEGETP
jgi:predicted nucleic acid-binding protein